jgi:hypothetical protein
MSEKPGYGGTDLDHPTMTNRDQVLESVFVRSFDQFDDIALALLDDIALALPEHDLSV